MNTSRTWRSVVLVALLPVTTAAGGTVAGRPAETLRSTASLPVDVVGQIQDPVACHQGRNGDYYVFDRRGHAVYRVPPGGPASRIVQVGPEPGRILSATAFDLYSSGQFAVADSPHGRGRIQLFSAHGSRIGGFWLSARDEPGFRFGTMVLNGIGALQLTASSVLLNQPERGGLVTEYSLGGHPRRTFGLLRPTGQEDNQLVHLALNRGIPRVAPDGGVTFVFQTGVPLFRRYDAEGRLLFERHIEGTELDPILAAMPTHWPFRSDDAAQPVVPPTVQAAAIDRTGHLWIALSVPVVYVYDGAGDKVRSVRLRAAGLLHPTSLAFSDRNTLLVTPGCYEFEVW